MDDPLHLVIAEGLSKERREVCHEIIKEHADGWWHQMADVWVVGGLAVDEWRDLLTPVVRNTGASILVLLLPADGQRGWAFFGPSAKEKMAWFHENYTS